MRQQNTNRLIKIFTWSILAIGLSAFNFLLNWTSGVNLADESWFLQVLNRFVNGESLYGDIFLGVLPLSVYITSVPVIVFGSEILVVKAVLSLSSMLTILMCLAILNQLTPPNKLRSMLLIAVLLIYAAPPHPMAPYQSLALTFSLMSLAAVISWYRRQIDYNQHTEKRSGEIYLLVSGITVALCFATKQNIGGYNLIALILSITMFCKSKKFGAGELVRVIMMVLLAFAVTTLIILSPTLAGNTFPEFADYTFLNKSIFTQKAGISYFSQFIHFALFFQHPAWESFKAAYLIVPYILPIIFAICLVLGPLKREKETYLPLTILFFFGAAFIGVFPRADSPHIHPSTSITILGIVYAWYYIEKDARAFWASSVQIIAFIWVAIGLVILGEGRYTKFQTGSYQISSLPHFHWALFIKNEYASVEENAKELRKLSNFDPFLFIPQAGFYYLVSGITNPTPFDYPLVTAFGLHGEEEVIDAIKSEEINTVCIASLDDANPLKAKQLDSYIKNTMKPIRDNGLCTIYQNER